MGPGKVILEFPSASQCAPSLRNIRAVLPEGALAGEHWKVALQLIRPHHWNLVFPRNHPIFLSFPVGPFKLISFVLYLTLRFLH